jgi:hypothetical protein
MCLGSSGICGLYGLMYVLAQNTTTVPRLALSRIGASLLYGFVLRTLATPTFVEAFCDSSGYFVWSKIRKELPPTQMECGRMLRRVATDKPWVLVPSRAGPGLFLTCRVDRCSSRLDRKQDFDYTETDSTGTLRPGSW